jgi:hypothetical protein
MLQCTTIISLDKNPGNKKKIGGGQFRDVFAHVVVMG